MTSSTYTYANNFFHKRMVYNVETYSYNSARKNRSRFCNRSFGISVGFRLGKLLTSVKKTERTIENDCLFDGAKDKTTK